jgi:hypothetical protein
MQKPMYSRRTSRIQVEDAPPPMRDAYLEHVVSNGWDPSAQPAAWLTHSVNLPSHSLLGRAFGRRANWADPDHEHELLLVLGSSHVVIVSHGLKRGTTALSIALAQASIGRRPSISASGDDHTERGVTISGFPGEHGRPGTFFVALGPEAAGQECEDALRAALARSV